MMTPELVDCTHLHSVFGPGCPYCWRPAGRDDQAGRGIRVPAAGGPDHQSPAERPAALIRRR